MNKKGKLGIAIGGFFLGAILLTGCTANFCSSYDQSHIMFALDFGVSTYYDVDSSGNAIIPEGVDASKIVIHDLEGNSNVKVSYGIDATMQQYINNANTTATNSGLRIPSINFWAALDYKVLQAVSKQSGKAISEFTYEDLTVTTGENKLLYKYGYLKFYCSDDSKEVWKNWNTWVEEIIQGTNNTDKKVEIGGITVYSGDCPTSDYIYTYQGLLNTAITNNRACLATTTGEYGSYGPKQIPVEISGKAWTDWKGLLEFILIWPIGALIDVLTKGFLGAGILNGWAQILSIFIVTIIVRSFILLCTFKSTTGNAKMTALQPEIQKIQNKYPNSKTNKYDQQRMSQEMMALYKKNKVNPMSSLLTLIIQFPVFICVWGAMQGSAYLSTGTFLGLNLSQSISSALFNAASWADGSAITALILFLLMAVSQVFSMLIPQWMQKKRAKDVAKLGKNPSANTQNKTMKIFTIVMLIMVIFMGFSLASGLGVYWFVGALYSIGQTFITQAITDRAQKNKKNKKVVN